MSLLVSAFAGPSVAAHDYPDPFAVKDHPDPNSIYDYKLWFATESAASSYRSVFLHGVSRWTIPNTEVQISEKLLTDPELDLKLTVSDDPEEGGTVQAWIDHCSSGDIFAFHSWFPAQNPTMHYIVVCAATFDQLPGVWFCPSHACADTTYFKKRMMVHEIGHPMDFAHTCTPYEDEDYCFIVDEGTGVPTFSDQQYLETSPMWANCCIYKTFDNPPVLIGWNVGMPAQNLRPAQPLSLGAHDQSDLFARWPSNP